jgi:hypothetical protein
VLNCTSNVAERDGACEGAALGLVVGEKDGILVGVTLGEAVGFGIGT